VPEASARASGTALRREVVVHVVAAALGAAVGAALIGTIVAGLMWRAAALSTSLTLVVVALLRAVALGRAEWRTAAPLPSEYRRVIARFGVAFLLVIAASS